MAKSSGVAVVLFSLVFSVEAQVNRYMVFFKDKNNSPYEISQPTSFLSQRSVDRRSKNNVPVTVEDVPVTPAYINQLKSAGATFLYATRWFNGALIQCDASLISSIQNLSSVARVELVAPGSFSPGRQVTSVPSGRQSSTNNVKTTTQLNMLGIDVMHSMNYKGEGVRVAVFDSGFPGVNSFEAFAHMQDNIIDAFNFVNRQADVYKNDDHGTEVLSVMAGLIPNAFIGGVYNADFCLYITESVPTEYRVEEYQWLFAAERADSAGVDVLNASLGYNTFDDAAMNYAKSQLDGKTAVITRAAKLASEKGIVVVVSGGNEGGNSWQLVTPPADADGIIAAGSVTTVEVKSSFSSIGPTSDGRIKPDLSAMGSATSVIKQTGSPGTASGTSVSSPLLASLAAGLIQANSTASREEIITAMKLTASLANAPNNSLGYGVPDFTAANNFLKVITEVKNPLIRNFSVYPNPAWERKIYLRKHDVRMDGPVSLEIINPVGQSLRQQILMLDERGGEAEVSLSDLPEGVLLLRIHHPFGIEIFKIVNAR
jgi:serine protease AprX